MINPVPKAATGKGSLFGRWNWYLPDPVAKILRVRPLHARAEPGRRGGEAVVERVGAP